MMIGLAASAKQGLSFASWSLAVMMTVKPTIAVDSATASSVDY